MKIDDSDFAEVSKHAWAFSDKFVYAWTGNRTITIHRFLLNPPTGMDVDHINHDRLDNRRSNLRICTRTQNNANRRLSRNNTSGYKGVYWSKIENRWIAQISQDKHRKRIGAFHAKRDAALAYNNAATKLWGQFALLNPV